jgi:hypothetical protein
MTIGSGPHLGNNVIAGLGNYVIVDKRGVGMAGTAKTAQKPADTRTAQGKESQAERSEATKPGLRLHTLDTPLRIRIPYFTPGDIVANSRAATSRLPAKELLYYGGLGALTVAGVIDWPVTLAVGGATLVLRGRRKGKAEERQGPTEDSGKQE